MSLGDYRGSRYLFGHLERDAKVGHGFSKRNNCLHSSKGFARVTDRTTYPRRIAPALASDLDTAKVILRPVVVWTA